jgi:hypothetical protein
MTQIVNGAAIGVCLGLAIAGYIYSPAKCVKVKLCDAKDLNAASVRIYGLRKMKGTIGEEQTCTFLSPTIRRRGEEKSNNSSQINAC